MRRLGKDRVNHPSQYCFIIKHRIKIKHIDIVYINRRTRHLEKPWKYNLRNPVHFVVASSGHLSRYFIHMNCQK
jgi:hypothetical protein